ncbi:MAG: prohibitin family protein [Clostridia bacterium]|nr:prohibitin family protein [Clostridia bacterium]MBQ1554483.1 prohibitin family protein [Clostridia bacterium]
MAVIIDEKKTVHIPKKPIAITAAVLAALMIIGNSVTIIDAGHTGVINTLGRVSENVLQEGLHVKIPFVQRIIKMDNRIVKLEVETEAFSKDLQTVQTRLAINYRVAKDKSYAIYKNVGSDYETVLVTPAVNEVLKAITAKYTAEESVANRSLISQGLITELNNKLNRNGIYVEDVNIINFEFSEAYIAAIEEKQVAEQRLLKAKTEKEEAIVKAEAEAETLRIQSEAQAKANDILSDSLSKNLIEYEKIQKWNGELPKVTDGSAIINFSDMLSDKK